MIDFLVVLTYVAEGLGLAGIVFGLGMLAQLGPPSTDTPTYWFDGQQVSAAEYQSLLNQSADLTDLTD